MNYPRLTRFLRRTNLTLDDLAIVSILAQRHFAKAKSESPTYASLGRALSITGNAARTKALRLQDKGFCEITFVRHSILELVITPQGLHLFEKANTRLTLRES